MARWAVAPYVKDRTLKALPLTRRGFSRTWSAATLKDMARVPYVRDFITLIAKHPPTSAASPAPRLQEPAPAGRARPRRLKSA